MINKSKLFILLILLLCACSDTKSDNSINITENNNLIDMYTGDPIELNNDLYVINIWASWCLECIQEHQEFVELSKNNSLENKVIFVLLQDEEKRAAEFVEEYGKGKIIFAIDPGSR